MQGQSDTSLIPTTVLTGFLGSGKTTLLNALLQHRGLTDTAVLVNEFGEVGIDHLLVDTLDEDVVLLNAGCLCCTIRNDLVGALSDLHEKRAVGLVPPFKRVVIETTGLADPAPILHTLLSHERVSENYCVDGIVTTIDAIHGQHQLSENIESLKQAAVADRLVVTKTDMREATDIDALTARLRAINPAARVLEVVNGSVEPSALLDTGLYTIEDKHPDVAAWLSEAQVTAQHSHNHHDVSRHDDRISSFALRADVPVKIHRLVAWIERLLEYEGENLLRLKGILDVEGSDVPIVVHGVQHIFHPLTRLAQWPDDERLSRLVLIGRDLEASTIQQSFVRDVLGLGEQQDI